MSTWNIDLIRDMGDFLAANKEVLLPIMTIHAPVPVTIIHNEAQAFQSPAWLEEPSYDSAGEIIVPQQTQRPVQPPMVQQNTLPYYNPHQGPVNPTQTQHPMQPHTVSPPPVVESIVIAPTQSIPQLSGNVQQAVTLPNAMSVYNTQRPVLVQAQKRVAAPKYARECLDRPVSAYSEIFAKDIERYNKISAFVNDQLRSGENNSILLELPQEMLIQDERGRKDRGTATIVEHFGKLLEQYILAIEDWEQTDAEHAGLIHNLYTNVPGTAQTSVPMGLRGNMMAQVPVTNVQLSDPNGMNKVIQNRTHLGDILKRIHDITDSMAVLYTVLQRIALQIDEYSFNNSNLIDTYYGLLSHMLDFKTTQRFGQIWTMLSRYVTMIGMKTVSKLPEEQNKLLQVLLAAPALPIELPPPQPSMELMPLLPPLVQAPQFLQQPNQQQTAQQTKPPPPPLHLQQQQTYNPQQTQQPYRGMPPQPQRSPYQTQPSPYTPHQMSPQTTQINRSPYTTQQQQPIVVNQQQLMQPRSTVTNTVRPVPQQQLLQTVQPPQQIRAHLQPVVPRNSERMKLFDAFQPSTILQATNAQEIDFIQLMATVAQDRDTRLSTEELEYLCSRFDLDPLFERICVNYPQGRRFTARDEIKELLRVLRDSLCRESLRSNLGHRLLKQCITAAFPDEMSSFIKMILTLVTQGQYEVTEWPEIVLFDKEALRTVKTEQALEWLAIIEKTQSTGNLSPVAAQSLIRFLGLLLERCTQLVSFLQLSDPYSEHIDALFNLFAMIANQKGTKNPQTLATFLNLLQALIKDIPTLTDRLWKLYTEHLLPAVQENFELRGQLSQFMQQIDWKDATFHDSAVAMEQLWSRILTDPDTVCTLFATLNWSFVTSSTDASLIIPFMKLYLDVDLLQPQIIPNYLKRTMEIFRDDDTYDDFNEALWRRISPQDFASAFNGKTLSRLVRSGCHRITTSPSAQLVKHCVS